jgi:hypothetical protein
MTDRKPSIITLAGETHALGKNIELWFDGELLFKIPCIEGESKDALALRLADALTEYAHANAPHVCPGCHAVAEPCAPGCIDAEMEARWNADPSSVCAGCGSTTPPCCPFGDGDEDDNYE